MKVYELSWDLSHLVDEDEDCSLVKFQDWEEFRFQLGAVQKYIPKHQIVLRGNFNIIPYKSDFPIVDMGGPLMSKRMVSIIEEDESVLLNKIDTVIVNDTFLKDIFDENKRLIKNLPTNTDYQFIQVLDFAKVFDRNNSLFKPLRSNPEKVGIIEKLALKEPASGFPALFKIEEKRSHLFINESTKSKFERKGINGCVYNEVDVFSLS